MSTYQKYLKDENDNIFSPIVSIDSIYGEDDKKLIDIIKDMIYPVGSIYTSVNNVSPEILFGGKWERFSRGRTLIGVDETDTNFDQALITGGEKTHILTEDELPKISGSAQVSNSLVSQGAYSDFVSSAWGNMSATQGNTTENYTSGSGLTSRSAKMKRTITFKFGNDQPHNNMPPYITVFIWKRIS